MPDSLECAIIQYAPHMYSTKAAAMRAARAYSQKTLSGKSWGMLCTDAKINLGFQGHIKFSEAMNDMNMAGAGALSASEATSWCGYDCRT